MKEIIDLAVGTDYNFKTKEYEEHGIYELIYYVPGEGWRAREEQFFTFPNYGEGEIQ